MDQKTIPHEHWCTVCKRPEGCEEKFCERALWDVCQTRPECKKIFQAATVHRFTESDILPCCNRSRYETPGDRMTTDPARVTCGKPTPRAEEIPTSVTPGHVPGCLCSECAPARYAMGTVEHL